MAEQIADDFTRTKAHIIRAILEAETPMQLANTVCTVMCNIASKSEPHGVMAEQAIRYLQATIVDEGAVH